ncbi:hypothetical protein M885DRAFT_429947 [Pelagophyceae sp. CCMP2097]|nr:hypothetical protein M885DRAFT_429947 [Pelagophyceae sp. CCMP2097]
MRAQTGALLRRSQRGFLSPGDAGGVRVDAHSNFLYGDEYALGPPRRRPDSGDATARPPSSGAKMETDWVLAMVLLEQERELPCHVNVLSSQMHAVGWRRTTEQWQECILRLVARGCVLTTSSANGEAFEVFWPVRTVSP